MSKVVSYKKGTNAKAVVRILLDNTGKNRNGRSSDYNFVRKVAEFGNKNGFVTSGQLSLLGCIYNRVIGKGKKRSWKNLK